MLRDLAGDAALSAALRAYDPEAEAAAAGTPATDAAHGATPTGGSDYFEKLIERAMANGGESSSLVQLSGPRPNLSWFFSDWVDADKGLPDIAIDSVFPSHTEGDNWLVAVNLSNSGYAAAEIPVTVSNAATSITQRVVVPARGKATLRILLQGQPSQVQANDGIVPETEASVHLRNLDAIDNSSSPSSPPTAVQQ
jgi:hypothetical protein